MKPVRVKKYKVMINRFTTRLLFGGDGIKYNRDELDYWQSKIFSLAAIGVIILFTPLALLGFIELVAQGHIYSATLIIFLYLFIVTFIICKKIKISIRKYFIASALYLAGIEVLIAIGPRGGGLVSIIFAIVLANCILNKEQSKYFMALNAVTFIILTYLFYNGSLEGAAIMEYGEAWLINAAMTQFLAFFLYDLMNKILSGLAHQTQIVKRSKLLSVSNEAKHMSMIANISDVIGILNSNGDIKYISPNIKDIFGVSQDEVYKQSIWQLLHKDEIEFIREGFLSILTRNETKRTVETKIVVENGIEKYIELTASNLISDPNIRGVLINFHDITERKLREAKIAHLNYHDSLTGLYNRAYFENQKIILDSEENLPLSIIIADINGLKLINDSLGHNEGDKLIVNIGKIMGSCYKKNFLIARTGGDEFKILMPNTGQEEAAEVAQQINSSMNRYNSTIDEVIHTDASIGYSTKSSVEQSLEEVIKTAEEYMYKKKLLDSRSIHSSLITSMRTALHEKSEETEAHAQRLIQLSREIGKIIGLSDQQFDELELFSTLHDIGKIGIDDQILKKPGKLDEFEWVEMKRHSEVGYRIAMSSSELVSIAEYILTHHERWDGKGYPGGLRGEEIPLLSRILAVVDAYDAMTEDRAYRKGLSKEKAFEEIRKNSGSQFDPEIADIFLKIMLESDLPR